ncbi:response regulator transcription factor [Cryptosporangium japonicum]|uniref:Response regulator transcription factor n=1 Tax=Cryptosporangium japonicum TaxID=80872 RepID=A0ABP3D3W1_9ACTN
MLLVEDDSRVRRALRLALADESYQVTEAGTVAECHARLAEGYPDVVLLDLMLPDGNGFDVCRAIRRHSDVPVIIVTARADSHDVVAGLEVGADDYVTKPLVAKELSARIRALMRRATAAPAKQVLTAGNIRIAVDERQVTRDGEPLDLTKTEFRLLCELAQADGAVCTREQLLEKVWNYDYFGDDRVVDVHIRRLRRKVEHDPNDPQIVQTVRGHGYRIGV